jgi:hypothetical protein
MQNLRLQLLGQPKSGTTWLEVVVFALARHCLNSLACRVDGPLDQRANRSFTLVHSDGLRMQFENVLAKHAFPPPGHGRQECPHAHSWLQPYAARMPCDLAEGSFDVAQLLACAKRCGATSTLPVDDAHVRFLHIRREPRAAVLSACYWYEPLARRDVGVLEACVRELLPVHVAWLKYREIWLAPGAPLRASTTPVTYETLLARPEATMRHIAARFLRIPKLRDDVLREAVAQTSAAALRAADAAYDMHDRTNASCARLRVRRPAAVRAAAAAAGGDVDDCSAAKVRVKTGDEATVGASTARWMDAMVRATWPVTEGRASETLVRRQA